VHSKCRRVHSRDVATNPADVFNYVSESPSWVRSGHVRAGLECWDGFALRCGPNTGHAATDL